MKNKEQELKHRAMRIREKTVELVMNSGGGHIGGDLSEVDILVSLYDVMRHDPANSEWIERDYFILSKGHASEAYYAILHDYGYLSDEDLASYGCFGSILGGHPTKNVHGVETNTGSLGHGLGLGVGIALGLKMDKKKNRVFVLTGDGELGEGSNWEAMMAASSFELSNLVWIIDRNKLQISGNTEDVMPLESLAEKIKAFGFHVIEVNGHDMKQLQETLRTRVHNKPLCIIANTIKGKGLPCAENRAQWHHKVPSHEQYMEMVMENEKQRARLKL